VNLQAYLGHRSINSTTRYAALAPGRFKNILGARLGGSAVPDRFKVRRARAWRTTRMPWLYRLPICLVLTFDRPGCGAWRLVRPGHASFCREKPSSEASRPGRCVITLPFLAARLEARTVDLQGTLLQSTTPTNKPVNAVPQGENWQSRASYRPGDAARYGEGRILDSIGAAAR
jgi:hypothetical protein